MATDKTAVTCYLDDDLLEYLTKYCTEYNITGKNKDKQIVPRLGTGLMELLKIISTIPLSDLPSISPNTIPSEDSSSLIEKKLEDRNLLSKILGKILNDSTMVSQLRDAIIPDEFNDHDDSILPNEIPVKYFVDDEIDNDKGEDDGSNLPNDIPVKYPEDKDNDDSKSPDNVPATYPDNNNKDDSKILSKIPVKYPDNDNDNKEDSKSPDNVPVKYLDGDKNDTSTELGTILDESQAKQTLDSSDTVKSKEKIDLLIDLIKVSDKEAKKRKSLKTQTRWAEAPTNIDKIPNDIVFSTTQFADLIGASSSSTISTWKRHNKLGNQEKIPQWFRDNFEFVKVGLKKKI